METKYYNLYDTSWNLWVGGYSTVKLSEMDDDGHRMHQVSGRPWLLTKQQAEDWFNRDWGMPPPSHFIVKELPELYVSNYKIMLEELRLQRIKKAEEDRLMELKRLDDRRRLKHAEKYL